MDFINQFTGGGEPIKAEPPQQPGGGALKTSLLSKFNNAAGGGAKGEHDEDALDKAVDMVQEKFFNAGPQDNESALEQMKDEQISDAIRAQYKHLTGKDFPIPDK